MEIIALMNACTVRYNFSTSQVIGRFFGIKLLPDVVPCIVKKTSIFLNQGQKLVPPSHGQGHCIVKDRGLNVVIFLN